MKKFIKKALGINEHHECPANIQERIWKLENPVPHEIGDLIQVKYLNDGILKSTEAILICKEVFDDKHYRQWRLQCVVFKWEQIAAITLVKNPGGNHYQII